MTSKNQLKDLVKQIIKEIAVVKKLKEVSATGGVSCPSSKMAFGKVKDRVSRQAGMIPVSGPSAEVNESKKKGGKFENPAPEETKTINEPIERDDVDYINKEKKAAINKKDTKKVKSVTKIQQLIKRSSPYSRLDEDADLNVRAEKDKFEAGVEASKFKLKSDLIKLLKSKLLNKQFTAHASKGYGQVKRDYTITVVDVNVADYYGEYQVILKGNDKKEYFVDADYKMKPAGGGEQPTERPAAPAAQSVPATPESEKAPAPTGQPATDLSKEIQK